MLSQRSNSPTAIHYVILAGRDNYSFQDYLFGPTSVNEAIQQVTYISPMDLLQLLDPELYYFMRVNRIIQGHLNLHVLYDDSIDKLIGTIRQMPIKVILVNAKEQAAIDRFLTELNGEVNVYCMFIDERPINGLVKEFAHITFVADVGELTKTLKTDVRQIMNSLEQFLEDDGKFASNYLKLFTQNNFKAPQPEKLPVFQAAKSNFYLYSQITGNIWEYGDEVLFLSEDELIEAGNMAVRAQENDADLRFNKILNYLYALDDYWLAHHELYQGQGIENNMNPIILCLPYQNPQFEKLAELFKKELPKELLPYFSIEQNYNYAVMMVFPLKTTEDEMKMYHELNEHIGKAMLMPRSRYIDWLSYLHASFSMSPMYRLPVAGKSLKQELNFLRPETGHNLSGRGLNKTLRKLGEKLNERLLNQDLTALLKVRNGQVVAITDLPVELMHVNGVPFCYTHDICRIPETNYKSGLSIYSLQKDMTYAIPRDIARRTLVLLGAPLDPAFVKSNKEVVNVCEELGITCKKCFSVSEVRNMIEEHRPEFLIIDCHGNFDSADLSSYLNINGEKLRHDDIHEINHVTPLVFLSACNTSPTFGYIHSIANAFFNKGSMSVTTTLLPISIEKGTAHYLRILGSLEKVGNNGNYPNWLSFLSTMTRTDIFEDVRVRIIKQIKRLRITDKKLIKRISDQLQEFHYESFLFQKRHKVFIDLDKHINSIDPRIRVDLDVIAREHLLYSNQGRCDLIYFQSYLDIKNKTLEEVVERRRKKL